MVLKLWAALWRFDYNLHISLDYIRQGFCTYAYIFLLTSDIVLHQLLFKQQWISEFHSFHRSSNAFQFIHSFSCPLFLSGESRVQQLWEESKFLTVKSRRRFNIKYNSICPVLSIDLVRDKQNVWTNSNPALVSLNDVDIAVTGDWKMAARWHPKRDAGKYNVWFKPIALWIKNLQNQCVENHRWDCCDISTEFRSDATSYWQQNDYLLTLNWLSRVDAVWHRFRMVALC